MVESTLTIDTRDGPMDAYLARPEGPGPAPGLLVFQEAFGVNEHIRDVTRRFGREGYAALAPDLFHRSGRGVTLDYVDREALMRHLSVLTNDGLTVDIRAALAALRRHPSVDPTRVGAVGFCMGGFAAFLTACRTDVATTVSFYGGGILRERPGIGLRPLLDETGSIRAPILLFFGAEDAGIPPADVETIRTRLTDLGKTHEVVVYPDAGHAFFCDARPAYRAEPARDAWGRTLAWLARVLHPPQGSGIGGNRPAP